MRRPGPGSPEPLGVTPVAGGANVAVFSAHATAIEFCVFDAAGQTEQQRIALPERTGDVFHGFVPGIDAGTRYGLRAFGPYDPPHGHRFNAAKLLVDPYATALDRPFALHPSQFGESPDGRTRNDADSAPHMPKAIVVAPAAPREPRRPHVPWLATVLYELHVRGFTRRHPGVPAALRGTCAGLAHPAAIAHLARLGVTTVELMPLAAPIDERHLARLGLTNYWGYNPVAWLAPDLRLAPGGMAEVAACVAALQDAGIEVLLDVVLNHTGEGDALGPTLSLRGLDSATYYRIDPGNPLRYVDDTGCGNTVALDRPPVLRLALDALRHWVRATGVDGLRFDLATTLGRRSDGFDPAAPLLAAIAQDPQLRELKLVAEPWDPGPGGYRLGAFPGAWGEWNDRYRDATRRFWRGDRGTVAELATRLAGSHDVFGGRSRPPSRSVNFIAAHDGFTLADLVAYERKHNEANGEDNRDGTTDNHSWNHGVEGPATDAAVIAARQRDVRNLLATLFLSRGTPMLAMGDELGRTQHGNNNAYAQDNALAWIDWPDADDGLIGFVAALARLRRDHRALRLDRWLTGTPPDGSGHPDVEWLRPDGTPMAPQDWSAPDAHVLVAVLYAPADGDAPADRVIVALNAGRATVAVPWPEPREGYHWQRAIDTAAAGGLSADDDGDDPVAARAVVVVAETPDDGAAPKRARRRGAGIEPAMLARLARAAGIAPDWWDVTGRRQAVSEATMTALLAAMGHAATSTADARARLAAIAAEREGRALPRVVVAPEDAPLRIPVVPGADARSHRLTLRVVRDGQPAQEWHFARDDLPTAHVTAADGRAVVQHIVTLPPQPPGDHVVTLDGSDGAPCRVVVVPPRCHMPRALRDGGRRFGLAAHLYSLRRAGDQGIGDFTTLALAAEATARAGGAIVGVNPLHALFAQQRERASPYYPSDRRFLDPLYIDVARVPDLAAANRARPVQDAQAAAFGRLAALPAVDYAGVWHAKSAVLAACFAAFERRLPGDPLRVEFDRFVAAGGEPLLRFATFEALAAAHPDTPWKAWPADLRAPAAKGIEAFARREAPALRFVLYLQWLADRQLGEAAARARTAGLGLGLYRDLAVGAAPEGGEAWANQDALARGASIGAPPDPFSLAGQVWGVPPPRPDALAAGGYAAFRELVAANMRHAGALRIDHAMGLARLFWVPEGARAADGAYVDYPLADLLGVLALESRRARCLVVGEDLGTVPAGLHERLDAANVLSYRVVWFERDGAGFRPPEHYPAKAAACVSTHDLPTIAGWWAGADIAEKQALGLIDDAVAGTERQDRATDKRSLVDALGHAGVGPAPAPALDAPPEAALTAAIHRFVGATPAALVLIQADDLAGETVALNLPGTYLERPNWRRKVGVAADALWDTPAGAAAREDLASRRDDPAADDDGADDAGPA